MIDALSLFTPPGVTTSIEENGKIRRPGHAQGGQPVLAPIWTSIAEAFNTPREREIVLVIDDIAFWEWSAVAPILEIEKFVCAVRASCRKVIPQSLMTFSDSSQVALALIFILAPQSNAGLIVLYHTLSAGDPPTSDVHRLLLETCTTRIDCRPLASGRSGAVSGEVRHCLVIARYADMTAFADDHSLWTVFLECRPTTVDSIQTHRRKRGLLSKGDVDGSYLTLVTQYSRTCQTNTRHCRSDGLRNQGIRPITFRISR